MLVDFNCDEFYLYTEQLKKHFPFVNIFSVGKTVLKRDIMALCIGTGEKSVLFLGGMNASDILTPAMLIRFFERLCISAKNDLKISAVKTSNILKEQKIIVIPFSNPDGSAIFIKGSAAAKSFKGLVLTAQGEQPDKPWYANARGVEPYLNFNYRFPHRDIHCKPSPQGNYGPNAESEAETRAIADFIRKNDVKYSVLLSAYGEKIIYSPQKITPESALMSQIFKSISGFPAECRGEYESQGSFCEWFTSELCRASFEFSFNSNRELTADEFESTYLANEELLMLSAIM